MTEAALEVKFVATEIKDFEEDKEFKSAKEARRRLERANGMLDLTKENYLNAADWLCHSILKGYLRDRDWRSEYRQYFQEMWWDYADEVFDSKSPYSNIRELGVKWKPDRERKGPA
jgi:hypothetical protein